MASLLMGGHATYYEIMYGLEATDLCELYDIVMYENTLKKIALKTSASQQRR